MTIAIKGIGLATARRFVEEGAQVALLDIDAEKLEKAAADLGGLAFYVCDTAQDCQEQPAGGRGSGRVDKSTTC